MITREAPQSLINAVQAYCPEIEHVDGAIVAGGFIRAYYAGEEPSDLDVYFNNAKQAADAITVLTTLTTYGDELWRKEFETDRAVTFRRGSNTVQFIQWEPTFGTPEEVLTRFDFTVCCAALTLDRIYSDTEGEEGTTKTLGTVWMHDDFFEHLAGRLLVATGAALLPLSTLKRVVKYLKRGYSICDENLVKIAEMITRAIDFNNSDQVNENVQGMDPDGNRRIRVID